LNEKKVDIGNEKVDIANGKVDIQDEKVYFLKSLVLRKYLEEVQLWSFLS